MDRKIKIGLVVLSMIFLILVLNYFGLLSFINSFVEGTPDKSCAVDADCALKHTTCNYCDCGDAVNKDWNSFCPFKIVCRGFCECEMCPSPDIHFQIKCVDNQCQQVWINK